MCVCVWTAPDLTHLVQKEEGEDDDDVRSKSKGAPKG